MYSEIKISEDMINRAKLKYEAKINNFVKLINKEKK
tara:strand:+ start:289 stop:396 length:108 start_codon:yes stop_codon:yes gene_type:complete